MKKIPKHEHRVGWIGNYIGCVICGSMADATITNPQPQIVVKKWLKTKIHNWRDKI